LPESTTTPSISDIIHDVDDRVDALRAKIQEAEDAIRGEYDRLREHPLTVPTSAAPPAESAPPIEATPVEPTPEPSASEPVDESQPESPAEAPAA
jgi:hypothetical protein